MAGVKIVLYGVVVGRGGDDHEVGVGIGPAAVEGGGELQRLLGQVALDIVVLDGGYTVVDLLHLLGYHVNSRDTVVLRKQRGNTQADVAGSGNGDTYVCKITHIIK